MRVTLACAVPAFLLVVSGCTSQPLGLADWILPVPEGTPVIEYAGVPLEDRSEQIEWVEDLVIGGEGREESRFYHAFDVGVDHEGSIYVFDAGNYRIQVFSHEGEYLRTIGGRGEGPAEISDDSGRIAVGGDRIVHQWGFGQISVWTLEGESVFRGMSAVGEIIWDVAVSDDEKMVGLYSDPEREPDTEGSYSKVIGGFGPEKYSRFTVVPVPERPKIVRTSERGVHTSFINMARPDPVMAVSKSGAVYFTTSEEYQVFSTDASGNWRWALRVAWPRFPVSNADIESAMARTREHLPDAQRSEVDWPSHYPALSIDPSWWERSAHGYPIRVDGHGNLYVFPLIYEDRLRQWRERDPHILRPVDVYTPDGERVFTGMIHEISWHDAWGDYIYGIELDSETDEQRIVRYRLLEPF
jgi:hypothetical protein